MTNFLQHPKFLTVALAIFSLFFTVSIFASGIVPQGNIYTLYNPWGAGFVTGSSYQAACSQGVTFASAVNPDLANATYTAGGLGYGVDQCIITYAPNGASWFSNMGTISSAYGCPLNSTVSASACTCDTNFIPDSTGKSCVKSCTTPAGTQFDVAGSGSPTTVCYLGCSMPLSGIVTVTLSSGASGYSAIATSSGQQCNGESAPSSGQATSLPPPAASGVPPVIGQPDPCIVAGTCTPVNAPCLATNSCTGTGTGPGGTPGGGGYGNGTGTGNQDLINYLNSATNVTGHDGDLVSTLAKQKLLIDAVNADSVSQSVIDRNFITSIFYFAPVANSCAPYSGVIHGFPVTINICTYTEMLRSLLTWLLGLFTAWIVFTTIFRAKT